MGEVLGDPDEVMRELGAGSVVGELAVLTGAARSASVRVRRDATLIRLRTQTFDELLRGDPGFAQGLVRSLGAELQRSGRPDERAPNAPRTVAIVSLSREPAGIEETLVSELLRICPTAQLDARRFRGLQPEAEIGSGLAHVLDRLEREHALVVLLAGQLGSGEWAEACVRQADRVLLLVTEPGGEQAELSLLGGCDAALLVGAEERGVIELLDAIGPRSTQRIRGGESRAEDVARLARRLAGRSVGLVMSGGGARGFAHIGAIEELLTAGVAIDRVGGSSMGAFIGALLAQGAELEEIDARCYEEWVRRKPLSDYTLPRVSLLRGARVGAMVRRSLPGRFEDLPRPFYCVTTDLIAGRLAIHRRGELALAVGASMSFPGIVPPVPLADSLHVDGAVLSNLPVEPMVAQEEGPVIACDLSRPERDEAAGSARMPSLAETLMLVLQIASSGSIEHARSRADLVITPAHESVGPLEFHAIDVMRESGRRAARAALEAAPPEVFS